MGRCSYKRVVNGTTGRPCRTHDALRLSKQCPHGLAVVGAEWGQQQGLDLHKAHEQVPVQALAGCTLHLTVPVTGRLQVVEPGLEGVTIHHPRVCVVSLSNGQVNCILKHLVVEHRSWASTHRLLARKELLCPLQLCVEPQDCGIYGGESKVCILHTITSIGKRKPGGISTIVTHTLIQGLEVARALAHLLAVDQQMPVGTHSPGEVLRAPDSSVCVEEECQMVANQILAAAAQIHRVPVLELTTHGLKRAQGDVRLRLRGIEVDVVPHSTGHLLGPNAGRGRAGPVKGSTMKEVGHGVVCHVDGGVRERLNQILGVPRKLGAEAERARARPLVQPVQGLLEVVLGLVRVHLRVGHALAHLLLPLLQPVVQVPLVAQSHHTLVCRPRHDLPLRLVVHSRIPSINHLLLDLSLCIGNLRSLVGPGHHHTLVEALEVNQVLCLLKGIGIVLALDFELLAGCNSCGRAQLGNIEDGNDLIRQNHLIRNAVLLPQRLLVLEVTEGSIVVRRVRWH
eukprot:comp20847_c0_seq1/m.27563 comp20847_c0_seq1/g.27563  ORF comp20847_c0_seq1/g.27563 comp20847_c0_seq1/m.27563 type:complete len:511 (+) comp20847_c0_seq1:856-2388(+)